MLLTLILNLGMAAGPVAAPPVTLGGAGLKARRPNKGHTFLPIKTNDKQKKDDEELLVFLDLLVD